MDKLVGTLGLYTANIINSAATWAEFARYPARYRRSMVLIEHGLDAPAATHERERRAGVFDLPLVAAGPSQCRPARGAKKPGHAHSRAGLPAAGASRARGRRS